MPCSVTSASLPPPKLTTSPSKCSPMDPSHLPPAATPPALQTYSLPNYLPTSKPPFRPQNVPWLSKISHPFPPTLTLWPWACTSAPRRACRHLDAEGKMAISKLPSFPPTSTSDPSPGNQSPGSLDESSSARVSRNSGTVAHDTVRMRK